MDYATMSAITTFATILVAVFFISYDIVCQWSVNLRKRIESLPQNLRIPLETELRFAVPKFHCPGHKLDCQAKFSFGLISGAAHGDGEGVERGWSRLNARASSCREMGPGSRHDNLDDAMGHSNWQKTKGLGKGTAPLF